MSKCFVETGASDRLKRFAYHPDALHWSNNKIKELRFKVLAEAGVLSGDSAFDVGCGLEDS